MGVDQRRKRRLVVVLLPFIVLVCMPLSGHGCSMAPRAIEVEKRGKQRSEDQEASDAAAHSPAQRTGHAQSSRPSPSAAATISNNQTSDGL